MTNHKLRGSINAKGTDITVLSRGMGDDYLCLTDIARYKNPMEPKAVVANWIRLRNTIEYMGIWERLNNPLFKGLEFEAFMREAGANAFTLSPQRWIETTGAIGILSRSGRGGGTYAHKDIAFKFAAWISPEFELYIIKDYQRLKEDENSRLSLDWQIKRIMAKVNYRIQTDAIRDNLLPPELTERQKAYVYASEADLINTALFGMTASEWRNTNPDKKGNMRDWASIEQLLVLANLENINALYISKGMPQAERLTDLNRLARTQLKSLLSLDSLRGLPRGGDTDGIA